MPSQLPWSKAAGTGYPQLVQGRGRQGLAFQPPVPDPLRKEG